MVDGGFRVIIHQGLFELAHDLPPMLDVAHVDEIDDDDAAQVAQSQLPSHGLRRFQIGAVDRLLQVARAQKRAGIHIDRGHCLGLIDHQITTGFQRYLFLHGALNLVFHAIQIEDRALAGVVFDAVGQLWDELRREALHALEGLARVDAYLLHLIVQQISQCTHRQGQVFVDTSANLLLLHVLLNRRP